MLAVSAIAFLLVIVLGMWVLSLVSEQTEGVTGSSGQEISREEYGDDWAFTVDTGVVDCIQTQNGQGAVFRANGTVYQLDGIAASAGYEALDPIWRDNPDAPQGGPKVNVRPFVELALEQC